MNTDLLFIGIAFLIGISIAWLIAKHKYENGEEQMSDNEHHVGENSSLSPNGENVAVLSKKYSELEGKYNALEQKYDEQVQKGLSYVKQEEEIKTLNGEIVSLKEKNAKILADAEVQVKSLEKQLSESLNGHVDEAVAMQLNEAKKLKRKISDLEDEIEDYEDDILNSATLL